LYSAALKSYDNLQGGEVVIYQDLPDEAVLADKKILIVDDVLDSGKTFTKVIDRTRSFSPKEIRSAALDIKPNTSFIPDYYMGETNKWIIYPWELRETIETLWKTGSERGMTDNEIVKLLRDLGYVESDIRRYKSA
jgi:hypoxanthine phosphoribosyltransferase